MPSVTSLWLLVVFAGCLIGEITSAVSDTTTRSSKMSSAVSTKIASTLRIGTTRKIYKTTTIKNTHLPSSFRYPTPDKTTLQPYLSTRNDAAVRTTTKAKLVKTTRKYAVSTTTQRISSSKAPGETTMKLEMSTTKQPMSTTTSAVKTSMNSAISTTMPPMSLSASAVKTTMQSTISSTMRPMSTSTVPIKTSIKPAISTTIRLMSTSTAAVKTSFKTAISTTIRPISTSTAAVKTSLTPAISTTTRPLSTSTAAVKTSITPAISTTIRPMSTSTAAVKTSLKPAISTTKRPMSTSTAAVNTSFKPAVSTTMRPVTSSTTIVKPTVQSGMSSTMQPTPTSTAAEKTTMKSTPVVKIPTQPTMPTRIPPMSTTQRTDISTSSRFKDKTELCPDHVKTDVALKGGFLGQYGDFCFEVVNWPRPYDAAESHCQITSGHLVAITNQGEQDYIRDLLKQHYFGKTSWIGLNDKYGEGNYRWSSGASVTYSNFQGDFKQHSATDHEVFDCFVIRQGGEWSDKPCGLSIGVFGFGEQHPFICQYNVSAKIHNLFETIPAIIG